MNPMIAMQALSALAGLAPAVINAFPRKADRRNNRAIRELEALEEAGGFGLTGDEENSMVGDALEQNRSAQAGAESTMRRNMAATGNTTGEQLQAAARDQARDTARMGLNTKRYIDAADKKKAEEQQNELDQRIAVQSATRQDKRDAIFKSIEGGLNVMGQSAAQAPASADLGYFGQPTRNVQTTMKSMSSAPAPDQAYVQELLTTQDESTLQKTYMATVRNEVDSPYYNKRLRAILENSDKASMEAALNEE